MKTDKPIEQKWVLGFCHGELSLDISRHSLGRFVVRNDLAPQLFLKSSIQCVRVKVVKRPERAHDSEGIARLQRRTILRTHTIIQCADGPRFLGYNGLCKVNEEKIILRSGQLCMT
jgi:hypothetical protein